MPPMTTTTHFGEMVSFIWNVADLLRGDYKAHEYGSVILPFTVLRRLDQVLSETRDDVRKAAEQHKDKPDKLKHQMLLKAAGQTFYNTSKLDFDALLGESQDLAANMHGLIAGFSENARDLLEYFKVVAEHLKGRYLSGTASLLTVLRPLRYSATHPRGQAVGREVRRASKQRLAACCLVATLANLVRTQPNHPKAVALKKTLDDLEKQAAGLATVRRRSPSPRPTNRYAQTSRNREKLKRVSGERWQAILAD